MVDFPLAAKMAFVHTAVFRTLLYKIPPSFFSLNIYSMCCASNLLIKHNRVILTLILYGRTPIGVVSAASTQAEILAVFARQASSTTHLLDLPRTECISVQFFRPHMPAFTN